MSQKKKDPESKKNAQNVSSTDPGSVTEPPAEGRADIGVEKPSKQQQAASSTTPATDPHLESKEPAEGRDDIATDLAQEERQSYSAHHRHDKEKRDKEH